MIQAFSFSGKAVPGDIVQTFDGQRYRVLKVMVNWYEVAYMNEPDKHGIIKTTLCSIVNETRTDEDYILR